LALNFSTTQFFLVQPHFLGNPYFQLFSGLQGDCDTIQVKSSESLRQLESSHIIEKSTWDSEKHKLLENIKKLKQSSHFKERIKQLEDDLKHQRELFDKDIGSLRVQNNNIKSEAAAKLAAVDDENNQKIGIGRKFIHFSKFRENCKKMN